MRTLVVLLGLLMMASGRLHAAGPSAVASIDRTLWPDSVNSPPAFDRASRAEILAFAHALAESEQLNDDALRIELKLKELDREAVDRMRTIYWHRLAANYMLAATRCTSEEPFCMGSVSDSSFKRAAASFTVVSEDRYGPWFRAAQSFHRIYLDELLRLASLFPKTSSEVDTYSSRELNGNELADRQFLLTFDDGPTRADGNTDKLLSVLHQHHLNATFFMLGEQLKSRLQQTPAIQLDSDYEGMCVAAHGWEHKSHSSWPEWQSSVTRSNDLVHNNFSASYVPLFRPPYGQRRADSGEFFNTKGLQVALWNIDSQDWNSKVDADQVKQRVLTLMLLWRHGVILFHDIHPKAQAAVPWLIQQMTGSGVRWIDCHAFPPP